MRAIHPLRELVALESAERILLAIRWYFFAHGLRNLERNILGFCGIGPIRESLTAFIQCA